MQTARGGGVQWEASHPELPLLVQQRVTGLGCAGALPVPGHASGMLPAGSIGPERGGCVYTVSQPSILTARVCVLRAASTGLLMSQWLPEPHGKGWRGSLVA